MFEKGEMNTYHDSVLLRENLCSHLLAALDTVFQGQADVTLTESQPQNSERLDDSEQCKLLTFVWNRYCSVGEELTSRLEWTNAPCLRDVFMRESEHSAECAYVMRKLCVMRLLLRVISEHGAERNQLIAQADALFWADKVAARLLRNFDASRLNVSDALWEEINKFIALKDTLEAQAD